jgi:hypothetical protein
MADQSSLTPLIRDPEERMDDLQCPFSQALLPGDFGCRHARVVTRREGPAVACDDPLSHARCGEVLTRLKQTGLPALGHEDDLTQLPHGIAMKVQMGGLLGLQRLLDPGVEALAVTDVGTVVEGAVVRQGGVDGVPWADLVADMSGFQLKRRRR